MMKAEEAPVSESPESRSGLRPRFVGVGLPPRVPGLPILGSALALRRQGLLPLLRASQRAHGDIFRLRIGTKDNYVVANPEAAAHILQQNAKNYTKSRSYQRLVIMLGKGMFTTEGELWRRQRGTVQPFFQRQVINDLASTMSRLIDIRMSRWQASLARGQDIDVKFECRALNLDLISASIFGMDLTDEDSRTLGRATNALSDFVERNRWKLLPVPSEVPTPRNIIARYNRWCVDRVADRVSSSERSPGSRGLIAMLVAARDEQGELAFNEAEVRDQITTLLVAGYETTAAALSWTMYHLAKHPEVTARIRTEVDRIVGQRVPVLDDLNKLPYLAMVLNESMRLYPPAWVLGRRSIEADAFEGYSIPADAPIGIYPYMIHRHPDYWSRPDEFNPENFTPAAVAARPKLAFLPFGAGKRICIGNHLAMLELQLCLAMFVQRFEISVPAEYEAQPHPYITLMPPEGMPLRLRKRAG